MLITRRSALGRIVVAAGAAAWPFGTARAADMTPWETDLYGKAKAEGEVTWYNSHYPAEMAEAFAKAFQARYPGLKVNVTRVTAQVVFQRFMQEVKANDVQCDVFASSDLGHYAFLRSKDMLEKFEPENAAKLLPQFRNFDPDGYHHVTSADLVLLLYRSDKVQGADVPKKWQDLVDPKWKNQVGVGHPGFSGYAGTWVVLMRKLYSWDYFKKLEAAKPQIGRSINDTVTMLNSGERLVAAGPSAPALQSAAKGNPIALSYPEDGTLLMIAPSALPKASKHKNAAKLFINFMMGPEAAKVAVDNYSIALVAGIPPAKGGKPLDAIKTIRPTREEIEKGIPEVSELWRDTFGV